MVEAFSDYQIDMSYMTLERFEIRSIIGRVDFKSSVGAFSGDKLVGFTVIGIDSYKGSMAAFDAGTGIITEFRGKGIAGKMFDFSIPKLKENGIQKFYLEVLQENKAAIKAYSKTGFEIEREYICYMANLSNLTLNSKRNSKYKIRDIKKEELIRSNSFFEEPISWEDNISAVNKINNEIILKGAFIEDVCVGVIVYYPTLRWIMQLGVDKTRRRNGIASELLKSVIEQIKDSTEIIKMANILPGNPLNKFLINQGFQIHVKQYEMVCKLN